MPPENEKTEAPKKAPATGKKMTVEMTLEKECGSSVKYSCDNEDKTKAADNVYVYRKSPILKDGKIPQKIKVTIEAA